MGPQTLRLNTKGDGMPEILFYIALVWGGLASLVATIGLFVRRSPGEDHLDLVAVYPAVFPPAFLLSAAAISHYLGL